MHNISLKSLAEFDNVHSQRPHFAAQMLLTLFAPSSLARDRLLNTFDSAMKFPEEAIATFCLFIYAVAHHTVLFMPMFPLISNGMLHVTQRF